MGPMGCHADDQITKKWTENKKKLKKLQSHVIQRGVGWK